MWARPWRLRPYTPSVMNTLTTTEGVLTCLFVHPIKMCRQFVVYLQEVWKRITQGPYTEKPHPYACSVLLCFPCLHALPPFVLFCQFVWKSIRKILQSRENTPLPLRCASPYGKACPPSSYVMCPVGYHLFDVCVVTMTLLFVNPNSIGTIFATVRNMYVSCIHPFPIVVLFASPSVMMLFNCAPCGVALPMLGLRCATKLCRDLFLRPCFVSPQTSKNSTILCTENCPGHHNSRCAMPSAGRQVHAQRQPLRASERQTHNAMGTHKESLRGPHHLPQGVSNFKLQKQDILEGVLLCVTFSLYLCPFVAYLSFVVHVSLDTKGNEMLHPPPPLFEPEV